MIPGRLGPADTFIPAFAHVPHHAVPYSGVPVRNFSGSYERPTFRPLGAGGYPGNMKAS
jgi:hypothetical protein